MPRAKKMESRVAKVFGSRLRQARIERDLTQWDCAVACNMTQIASVGRWEKGEDFPTPDKIEIISEITGRPVDWFFRTDPPDASSVPVPGASGPDALAPPAPELGPTTRRKKTSPIKGLNVHPLTKPKPPHIGGRTPGIQCHFRQVAGL